jgi:hypothetical protein
MRVESASKGLQELLMCERLRSTIGASETLRRHASGWLAVAIMLVTWLAWPTRGEPFTIGKPAPDISGGPWLNSRPVAISDLKGRVVLVEFWTYG